MINFFRTIRKKLAAENRFMAYSRYAIGEIVLVVIGILIALQVNNWNELRKNRNKEVNILKELHKDFKNNLEEFIPIKEKQIRTLKNGQIVLRNIKSLNMPQSRDSVYKYATGMFGGYPYNPSNGAVESLISTGDISLIQNDTLRNYLVSWKDVLSNYSTHINIDREFWSNRIEPYIIEYGDFMDMDSERNKKLLTDTVFINMLVRKQFFQNNIVSAIQGSNGFEHYLREITRLSKSNKN